MLTAKSEERDVITGLDGGADDYMSQSRLVRECLLARVKSLMRRKDVELRSQQESTIEIRDLVIHPGRHEVTLGGLATEA